MSILSPIARLFQAPVNPEHPPSESMRDMAVLMNIRTLLSQDRQILTRHPILKHMVARYDAVVNDITPYGHPKSRTEPAEMFRDRINDLTVEIVNKRHVKRRKQDSRTNSKSLEKQSKNRGKKYYQQTSRKSKNA